MKSKLLFSNYYPNTLTSEALPANYQYIQLYTFVKFDEKGRAIKPIPPKRISVKRYKLSEMEISNILLKPISKILLP